MRVNFASGPHPFGSDWIDIDLDPRAEPDECLDLTRPFPKHLTGITDAYVGHFLEHLTPARATTFLRRVRARMTTNGRLYVVGPDVEKARRWVANGMMDPGFLTIVGRHANPDGSGHLWDCTGHDVVDLVKAAAWRKVQELPIEQLRQWPHVPMIADEDWQFFVTALA